MGELKQTKTQQPKKIKKYTYLKWTILVINVAIMTACSIITTYQCTLSVVQFFARETRAIISVVPTGNDTFMGLTICPRYEEAYKLKVLNRLNISLPDYRNGRYYPSIPTNITYFDVQDGYDIFRHVSFNLSEIMTVMNITTTDTNNGTIMISFDKPFDERIAKWSELFSNTYGRCYSMQISEEVAKKEVTNIVLVSKMGLHVYMHHPGQSTNTDSKTKIYGLLGKTFTLDVTYELLVNTLEKSHGGFPCNSTVDYAYDDFITNEITKALLKDFDCLVPFLPPVNGSKVCKFDYSTKEGLSQMQNVSERYSFLTSSGQRSLCPAPCSTMDVFVGLPFTMDYNASQAYVRMNMKTTMKKKKTVFDYTLVELWADIGGYTGLLLGTSVVHLLKSIDWVRFGFRAKLVDYFSSRVR